MQRSQNSSQDIWNPARRRVSSAWTTGFLAAHAIILLALVGLVMSYPPASQWISQAAQAEFTDSITPAAVPAELAEPASEMRTVSAN
jgi:hypothetical protein